MTAELISAVIAMLVMIGSILTVWVKLNIKLKEMEMKILEISHKIEQIDQERADILATIEKNNDRIYCKLDDLYKLVYQNLKNNNK
jgi:hypothetical protein